MSADRDWADVHRCRHCGLPPEPDGDHSCPCPYPDADCPNHPQQEADA